MEHIDGRWGELIEESKDKGPYKLVRVNSEGHEFDAILVEPSGLQASPIKGSQLFVLPFSGDNGQAMVVAMPPPANRVDKQKPGEVSIKQHKTGNRLHMDDGGDTKIATKRHAVVKSSQNTYLDSTGVVYINCGGPSTSGMLDV